MLGLELFLGGLAFFILATSKRKQLKGETTFTFPRP